jgi:thiol-disulfide isomerase/thioredoxin
VRPPVPNIPAPPFPAGLPWVNVAMLRMDKLKGAPVLVEFWDFCRVNSLRTLPYLTEWHRRYRPDGLRVVGVHVAGFPPSQDPDAVRAACERLGVEHAIVVDVDGDVWEAYGNQGWPARYLWTAAGFLHSYHYGEGAYAETEHEIQELLEIEREVVAPVRPEDDPDVLLPAQTADQPGAYSGPYEAGGVWAVVSGEGALTVDGREIAVTAPGCVPLVEHERHTAGKIAIEVGAGVECFATCFTPGVP